jgi:hypothetical protein
MADANGTDAQTISSETGTGSNTEVAAATPEVAAPSTPAADTPVEYEFKLPEGVKLDEEILGQFKSEAQSLKLPADKAQALVDMGAKSVQKAMDAVLEADKARRATWAAEAESDTEFGGPQFKENLAVAKTAIETFSPKLKTFLDETGLGNHPDMIRFAFKVGQLIKQDGFVNGKRVGPEGAPTISKQRDHAKTLYPNMK